MQLLAVISAAAAALPFLLIAAAIFRSLRASVLKQRLSFKSAVAIWLASLISGPYLLSFLFIPLAYSLARSIPTLQVAAWDIAIALNYSFGVVIAYVAAAAVAVIGYKRLRLAAETLSTV